MAARQAYSEDDVYFVFTETSVMRIRRLPLELITCIMEFLPQEDLWRAASASHEFYAAALAVGLEIHRKISLLTYERDVSALVDIVDYIAAKTKNKGRMDLALTLNEGTIGARDRDITVPAVTSILQAITKSLPVLTRLVVALPSGFCAEFYDAVACPAPRLRTFVFTQERDKVSGAPTLPIPSTLFGGTALRLIDVTLNSAATTLSGAPIPAFAGVRRVALNCSHSPRTRQLVLSASFPAVRSLALNINSRTGSARHNPHKIIVDLSGLALDRLLLSGTAPLEHVRPLGARPLVVSKVDYFCGPIQYSELLWPAGKPELNAHIRRREMSTCGLLVAISSIEKDWSFTVYGAQPKHSMKELMPLARLPPLHTQLVSLTIEEYLLPNLVRTPHTLHALRELFVDCTFVADDVSLVPPGLPPRGPLDSQFNNRYIGLALEHFPDMSFAFAVPALKTVTALARSGAARVASGKLTALGLALGQVKVPLREERAELVLAGVKLDDPAFALLHETYCAVREVKFTDTVVPRYCDYRPDDPSSRF